MDSAQNKNIDRYIFDKIKTNGGMLSLHSIKWHIKQDFPELTSTDVYCSVYRLKDNKYIRREGPTGNILHTICNEFK